MNVHLRHWLEKAQVQLAAVAALAAMWFFGWPLVLPWDPQGPLTFIPDGAYGSLGGFVALVWALSALVAVATLSARAEGALLAVLVGVCGLSLHCGQMRALLWERGGGLSATFAAMGLEAVVMGVVLAGSALIIWLVRGIARRIAPRWVWSDPPEAPADPGPTRKDGPATGRERFEAPSSLMTLIRSALRPAKVTAVHTLACLVMEIAMAIILLVLTFRSSDRGQIAFALAASFFLAAWFAHQTFPVRFSAACWLGPPILSVAVFMLGTMQPTSQDPSVWHDAVMVAGNLPLRAALPVDWLAFGGAGAVGGFWLSRRYNYSKQQQPVESDRQ